MIAAIGNELTQHVCQPITTAIGTTKLHFAFGNFAPKDLR